MGDSLAIGHAVSGVGVHKRLLEQDADHKVS